MKTKIHKYKFRQASTNTWWFTHGRENDKFLCHSFMLVLRSTYMVSHSIFPALIILAFGLINASACLLRCTSWKTLTSIIFKFKQGWFENFSHGHWRWAIIQTNECKNAFQLDVNQKANLLNAMLALLSGEGSGLIMRKSPVQIGPPSISTYTHFQPGITLCTPSGHCDPRR